MTNLKKKKILLVICNKTLSTYKIKKKSLIFFFFFCKNKLTVDYNGEHKKINNHNKKKLDNFIHIIYLFVCRNINRHGHFIVEKAPLFKLY